MNSDSGSTLLASLLERIQGREDLELEFKEAHEGLPRSVWPTLSAFANTRGGWLVLGVKEEESGFEIRGVAHAAKILQDLTNLVRNPQKISFCIVAADDMSIEKVGAREFSRPIC